MASHHTDPIPGRIRERGVFHPGTWIAAVIVAVLVAMFIHGLITNTNYQWDVVNDYIRDVNGDKGVGRT